MLTSYPFFFLVTLTKKKKKPHSHKKSIKPSCKVCKWMKFPVKTCDDYSYVIDFFTFRVVAFACPQFLFIIDFLKKKLDHATQIMKTCISNVILWWVIKKKIWEKDENMHLKLFNSFFQLLLNFDSNYIPILQSRQDKIICFKRKQVIHANKRLASTHHCSTI